jgi:type III secretion system HrpE/YscL family protein
MTINRFTPPTKIIAGEELGNIIDGSKFLRLAQTELKNVKRNSAENFEKARERGYEEGVRRGRQDALRAMRSAVEDTRKRLMMAEDDLEHVVMEAVEKIIGTMNERQAARRALHTALSELASSVTIDILVSPDDLAEVRTDVDALDFSPKPEIRSVKEDSLLKSGEIVIVTPQGRIQVGLAQQLSRLRATLQNPTD